MAVLELATVIPFSLSLSLFLSLSSALPHFLTLPTSPVPHRWRSPCSPRGRRRPSASSSARRPIFGLDKVILREVSGSSAEVYLYGGQVMSWKNDHGEELLSVSSKEEAMKKKYGGLLPKKRPLITKDNERAFFDSADWALVKQGAPVEKPKGPHEALRPKLQPTHQQVRSRRSVYAPTESKDGSNAPPEDLNNNE